MIIKIAEGDLKTKFGKYHEIMYYDGLKESFALVMGEVFGEEEVLCRVHSSCIFAHHFNSIECDCREQMEMSQQIINDAGKGVIIWLEQEGKSNGHYALLVSAEYKKQGMTQAEAFEATGFQKDARDFVKAAEILKDLGVRSIRMLTNNPNKVETLTKHGINVVGTKEIIVDAGDNKELKTYLDGKIKDGHSTAKLD